MALINNSAQPQDEGSGQEEYEKIVMSALSVLNDSSDQVVNMLQQSEDPAQGMAEIAALIISQLEEQSGGELAEELILPASEEILENVAEIAGEAQLFEITPELLEKSGDILELELAEIYDVDPQEVQDYAQENYSDEERQQMTSRFGAQNGAA